MTINTSLTPLTSEQSGHLKALLNTLDEKQAAWVSGYLSAWLSSQFPSKQLEIPANKTQLTILFSSVTGKGELLASKASETAKSKGLHANLLDIKDFKPSDLLITNFLLLIVSTHGNGAPPITAKPLLNYLESEEAPTLNALKYSVLALGDSSYPDFCQAGIQFDQLFANAGAQRITPIHLGDIDVVSTSKDWLQQTLDRVYNGEVCESEPIAFKYLKNSIKKKKKKQTSLLHTANVFSTGLKLGKISKQEAIAPVQASLPSKTAPFLATVLSKTSLHGQGTDRETIHLTLNTKGSGLSYQPGDSAGIIPQNSLEIVQEILKVTRFNELDMIEIFNSKNTLKHFLQNAVELSKITLDVLKRYQKLGASETLSQLMDDKTALTAYMNGRDIVDLLTDYPIDGLKPLELLQVLRPLQPRFYSIASSPLDTPDELHLTVGVVSYELKGRTHHGTCTTYLSTQKVENELVSVFIEPNPRFRLPKDSSTAIIMMGAGTGIAPYRAFLQHRSHEKTAGKSWLFFGNRHQKTEFLYQNELEEYQKQGLLTKLDTAFSRDGKTKNYIQHQLKEHADELYEWLEQGAHLYLCGNADKMAEDVQETLIQIVAEKSHKSRPEAESFLDKLQLEGRFQLDVY